MSLLRTALRLSVIEALKADPPIAGLCGPRIFDSRLSELDADEPVPVMVVLTEDATGHAYSANNGGVPFAEKCDLVIEISLRIVASADGQPTDILLVETDKEAEATLDLLEYRALETITIGSTPQSQLIRDKVTRRATEFKSIRFGSDETGIKLAVRMLHLTVELKDLVRDDPRQPPPTGLFAALPEPLRSVAAAMPAGSSAQLTCQTLAARLGGPPALVPTLAGMDVTIAPRPRLDESSMPTRPAAGELGQLHDNFGATVTPPTT